MSDDATPRKKTKYSDDKKRDALVRIKNGEKITDVAKALGIPTSTISTWKQSDHQMDNVPCDNTLVNIETDPSQEQQNLQAVSYNQDNSTEKVQLDFTCEPFKYEKDEYFKEVADGVGTGNKATITQKNEDNIEHVGGPSSCISNDIHPLPTKNPIKRKKHDKEQQKYAVHRVLNMKESIALVSKEMNIPPTTISTWVKKNTAAVGSVDEENAETDHCGNNDSSSICKPYAPLDDRYIDGACSEPSATDMIIYSRQATDGQDTDSNSNGLLDYTNGKHLNRPATLQTKQQANCLHQICNEQCENQKGKKTEHLQEKKDQVMKRIRNGETIAAVSRDTGIPQSTIHGWKKNDGNCIDKKRNDDEKTQKIKREDAQTDNLKWKKWQDVMSLTDHGKGWTKRHDAGFGFRFERLGQYFEDKYGLFEIAVRKQSKMPVKSDRVVFVKDGKVLTLLERYCKYGFQKSELINDKLRDGYTIKARCHYTDTEEEAAKKKTMLLEKYDYAWNKSKRDDIADGSLYGSWEGWIVVMSPDKRADDWTKRDGANCGFYENLQSWFHDKYGVLEIGISNSRTQDGSIVSTDYGKILTCVRQYCTGHARNADKINEALFDGYDIFARCYYTTSENEARKAETELLTRYEYRWHRPMAKRENVEDDHFTAKWTDWIPLMTSVYRDGWCSRGDTNTGFRYDRIETTFEDKFGVFELKIERTHFSKVVYVQHGNIVSMLQRYCSGDSQIEAMLKRALKEEYSVSVRCHYMLSGNGKEEAAKFIRQLLQKYDYSWSKSCREEVDDAGISGDWSDWVIVLTPRIQQGWKQRDCNDVNKGYRRENFAHLFEEKYGIFEMKVCSEGYQNNVGQKGTVVYIGKGNILTEVNKRCCYKTKQSLHIDQALRDCKGIFIRYCYTKNDCPEEADDLERQLLDRYDYPWIRTKREDIYDINLSGEWSEWEKIMKPGEVETDWTWRDERYIGFKIKNIDRRFRDKEGVFEIAVEKPDQDVVVHLGRGKILSELKKYCKINTDGSYKSLPISDSLAKRYNILVRYREAQSGQAAAVLESQLLDRYDYPWNWTKREDVDDTYLPGDSWSEWEIFMAPTNKPDWIRRDQGQTGYRLTDTMLANNIDQNMSGVYEWRIEKHGRSRVVYVGKAENLLQRLTDYCKNGSHKGQSFMDALSFGYSISVRFRYTVQPDDTENELLDRYDYAWNIVRNNRKRNVFQPDSLELQ